MATKVLKRGVEFISADEASETVRKSGPASEVVAQARAQSCSWGLVVDDLNIMAHFLKSLSEGKALEQGPKVIHVVKCEDPDFHDFLRSEGLISEARFKIFFATTREPI